MARKKRDSPNPGLTPTDLMEQIKAEVSNEDVQEVRPKRTQKRRSVLFSPRPSNSEEASGGGVFRTSDVSDTRRPAGPEPTEVPDNLRVADEAALSDIVREVMQSESGEIGMSYLRQMVTQVALKAAKGDQWAVDWIGNRYEGKPGQAPKRTTSIEDTEQAIDQVEVATLNHLAGLDNGGTDSDTSPD